MSDFIPPLLAPLPSWHPLWHSLWTRLQQAGLHEAAVCRWFGVPLVTDVRWVAGRVPTAPARGLGAWIALLVAGESVSAQRLAAAPISATTAELALLVEAGVLSTDGDHLRARIGVMPMRGLLLVSDRLDERHGSSLGAPDLSALNTVWSLPRHLDGRRHLDVGCGAGVLALATARAGAQVVGGDVDRRALTAAAVNRALASVEESRCRFIEADLYDGLPSEPHELVTFNAPLVRVEMATADPGASARYVSAPGAEGLVLRFLDGLMARLAPTGEGLLHAQHTPAIEAALEALPARVLTVTFASAPDGTPHALSVIRPLDGNPASVRRVRVPLSPACLHLGRAVIDAYLSRPSLAVASSLRPAPLMELVVSRQLGVPGPVRRRFGNVDLDAAGQSLLERLDGRPLGGLGLTDEERALVARFAELGLVI